MRIAIVITKEVAETEEARQIYELVKSRLQDRPDITITGQVTNHFDTGETPE